MLDAHIEHVAKILFTNIAVGEKNTKIILTKKRAESKVKKINEGNIEEFINTSPYSSRDIQGILDIINKISAIESLDQSLIKLSSLNTPLMKTIKEFLYDNKLTIYEKQVYIEKTLVEYELDYFSQNMESVGGTKCTARGR